MRSKNIVVIGASAGGFEALKKFVAGIPKDFSAPIFIVWHMAPDVRGVLPKVLNWHGVVPAEQAVDGEPIKEGRIYVAPPDRHMLIEDGKVRVSRGPKENRFRPAVDPLFRSAAYYHGPDVIGIIMSGALDDGTSGLWTIKDRGGVAIVQDPHEAEVPSMPENALREVAVDHIAKVAEMPKLIAGIIEAKASESNARDGNSNRQQGGQLEVEIGIAAQDNALESGIMEFGTLTPYTCPECHGVLSSLTEGNIKRFRCHTGHAFTADSLLAALTESIEEELWSAIRGVDESIILLNHMGDHFAEVNQPRLAARFFQKANEARSRNELMRQAVLAHEQFSTDSLRQEDMESEFASGEQITNQAEKRSDTAH